MTRPLDALIAEARIADDYPARHVPLIRELADALERQQRAIEVHELAYDKLQAENAKLREERDRACNIIESDDLMEENARLRRVAKAARALYDYCSEANDYGATFDLDPVHALNKALAALDEKEPK